MKTLILTVGLPRSGKTTWAKAQGFPVVNPDAIRLAKHGQPFLASEEEAVWEIVRITINSLFIYGFEKVILDSCNINRVARDKWSLNSNAHNHSNQWYKTDYAWFHTPKSICIRRAISSNTEYLVPIIEKYATKYEELTQEEYNNCRFLAYAN